MPWITKEEVKAIRQNLKKQFPKFKFQVKGGNSTSLYVTLIEGSEAFSGKTVQQVNPYRYIDSFEGSELDLLDSIFKTIQNVKPRKTESEDSDYGSIPNYYLNVSIGSWVKPYKQIVC